MKKLSLKTVLESVDDKRHPHFGSDAAASLRDKYVKMPGYKSPEALAIQSQNKEKALREHGILKQNEQKLSQQIQKLQQQLNQIKVRIAEIEEDHMSHTDLEEFDF